MSYLKLTLAIGLSLFLCSTQFAQYVPEILNPPDDETVACDESFSDYVPNVLSSAICPFDFMTMGTESLSSDFKIYEVKTPLTSTSATSPMGLFTPDLNVGFNPEYAWISEESRLFVSDDRAFLLGKVYNYTAPTAVLEIFLDLSNGQDYAGWSSQLTAFPPFLSRSYRDDMGLAAFGGDLWESWRYYEVEVTPSYFTGMSIFGGSGGEIGHIPVNYIFGFQVGEAANGHNNDFGFSAWISLEGAVTGQATASLGTIAGDLTFLGTVGELYCDDSLIQTWTVEDECGEESSISRVVAFREVIAGDFNYDGAIDIDDFIQFNSQFGSQCGLCPEDLTGDGFVNISDFLEFNSIFGD